MKFEKLSEQINLKTPTNKTVELLQEVNTEGKFGGYLTLRPTKAHLSAKAIFIKDPNDRYIVSQTSKTKMDRANHLHSVTLPTLKNALAKINVEIRETKLIDAYASIDDKLVIFEIMSINENNERDQVRHAVRQLFEYRYLYQCKEAFLCVVLSEGPHSQWLVNYLLTEHEMLVIWIQDGVLGGPSIGRIIDGKHIATF